MSAVPARTVLFQSHNRRGLGHLMRGLNIAVEVRAVVPPARVVMHTRNGSAPSFCPAGIECVVDEGQPETSWRRTLDAVTPDVVVYDTLLPSADERVGLPPSTRVAYVLRKCRAERHAAILADGFLDRVDALVVPHTPEEFGHDLPAHLRDRAVFTGLIARRPDPVRQREVRDRYDLGDAFVLVSTAGGGGFEHSATPFFEAVAATQAALLRTLPPEGLRHVVVLGPHHAGAPDLPGATVVESEPALVDLFAVADLVVAEGGYNSVSELRVTGTPAVFLPGRRTYDDQAERVHAAARQGVAVALEDASPEVVAHTVTTLVRDRERLRAMRLRHADDPVVLGNRRAAEHVLGRVPTGAPS